MKKTPVILAVLLAVAVIAAGVLGINLNNKSNDLADTQGSLADMTALKEQTAATLADTQGKLSDTETALADMTTLQEQTAGKLSETEGKLADTETALADMTTLQEQTASTLSDTETALADMTALQEQTASTLSETEGKLADTETALADMTTLQEQTAASLADTLASLEAAYGKLAENQTALADMTALQEQTASTLSETEGKLADMTALKEAAETQLASVQAELAALRQDSTAAADEPAWSPYTIGGYTTAILDGWTKEKYDAEGGYQYYYYDSSFIMVTVAPIDDIPAYALSNLMIESTYDSVLEAFEESGMVELSKEIIEIGGYKAAHACYDFFGMKLETLLYYTPDGDGMYNFSYMQMDDNDERRAQIFDLAIKHLTCSAEAEAAAEPAITAEAPAEATAVDYPDEADFEADLNRGVNVVGKTVTITPSAYKPDSYYGPNLWAGEHLNFVSDSEPDISVGETVTVRVTSVEDFLGSFIIRYELVE